MFPLALIIAAALLAAAEAFKTSAASSWCRHCAVISRRTATQLHMNMVDRFFRVVKSNVNNVLSNLEDPEKVLEQAVNDMNGDLVKIRQSYAEVSATQKRMEKQKEQAQTNADEWYKRAQLALSKNDEELAREALSRRNTQLEQVNTLGKQMDLQAANIEKLYASMGTLEMKITEAKRQKDAMIARARTAKTSVQVNDMLSNINGGGSNSMEAFERMKAKVETLEAQAEIAGELAATSVGTTRSLEERFKELAGDSAVEDELEALRRQLPGSTTKETKSLPSGVMEAEVVDDEYEKLKREMGKK